MRLGDRLRVETARREDRQLNLLKIDWSAFAKLDAMPDEIDLRPEIGGAKPNPTWSGTRIIIADLTEDWTEERLRRMAEYDFARFIDPFLDQKERPRVALIWNGDRLTVPWMNQTLLDHAHARVRGSYEIEKGVPQLRCMLEAINLGFDHPKEIEQPSLRCPTFKRPSSEHRSRFTTGL